ncbi:hypothetical protein I4U23_018574 [Adineta vaga]|nr:hypothetical protein I4U23_018574 [Adineta vaga]
MAEMKSPSKNLIQADPLIIPDVFEGYSLTYFNLPLHYRDDLKSVLIPYGFVQDRIESLASRIFSDIHVNLPEQLICLCVLKGGYRFFADLISKIQQENRLQNIRSLPMSLEFIRLRNHLNNQLEIIGLSDLNRLKNRNLLIIQDIIDTDSTMITLKQELEKFQPKTMHVVSLFTKRQKDQPCVFKPDYCGFEIPDQFVVGYALDYNEYFRDLEHICILKESAFLKYNYHHSNSNISQLRIQRKTLEQLTQERDELEKSFRLAESLENQKRDEEKTKKLQELIRTKDHLQSDVQNEKSLSLELDAEIREWEKKVRSKQTEVGGAHAGVTFNANVRKQERVLENRLDTALKRFNSLLSANGLLRSEIDNLRNERERYENLSEKSEKELRNLRLQLVECIEHSVASYEQRKDANSKAIILQNKAESDKAAAEAEMRELERQISHDRKLRDFMKLKAQERHEDEDLVTYRKRKEAEAAEKRRKEKEEHSVEAYESKFQQIQEISGEHDLQKLVDKFIEVEDKNFALFNYVNELNNQIETLQEEIADIRNEIRHFESQGVALEDRQKRKVEEIERKRHQATILADEYEEKHRATKAILDECRTGIDSIFKKIGCDRTQIDHLLQSHEGVTEDSMLRYLGIIEERTNELLTAQATISAKEQNIPLRERAPNLIGDGPSGPPPNVPIHLPNTEDRRDPDDREGKTEDELKPLTREELKQRAIDHVRNLEKRALQQEQSKYSDLLPTSREKATSGTTRAGIGADPEKTSPTRVR